MINRREQIKKKGFTMEPATLTEDTDFLPPHSDVDFSKIRVGVKKLEDAVINFGSFKRINSSCGDKAEVLKAINTGDYEKMREISNFFYKTSGIYARLCKYMAYLYRYDWLVTTYVYDESVKQEKILSGFYNTLSYLDNSEIKRLFGDIALKVIRNGCYYGYILHNTNDRLDIQELPPKYCRSRYSISGRPAVEFNMKFFDDLYRDPEQRAKILNLFPPEFKKGYTAYKEGKLTLDFAGDDRGWYLLDVENSIKFNINGEDFPNFISVIPAIIDLDEAQGLDRKKMQQQLLKIIIQKMPFDKNGDLIFDVDEAQQLHNNAVKMLGKAIGIDVLTTFAEVEVANMSDRNTTATRDELAKVERTVYNESGSPQMLFNTDGNIALEKSIINDEASIYDLILQFEAFLNYIIKPFNKNPKKVCYKAQILATTIYNYKDMAKLYKEQTQLGYSKMLAQVSLGQSQSFILFSTYFENDVLDLVHKFIPPLSSNVLNADTIQTLTGKSGNANGNEKGEAGRPEKPDDEKSTKTIQNEESKS